MATVVRRWTVDELWALPEDGMRHEIIDGEHYVTPAPLQRHQHAVVRLVAALLAWSDRNDFGLVLIAPTDVIFGRHTLVQPDLVVFPKKRDRALDDKERTPTPALVIEILSPSTARRDRITKRDLYRREHVPEYWIVDLDAEAIERWRPGDDRPEVVSGRIEWSPADAGEPLVIDLDAMFAKIREE